LLPPPSWPAGSAPGWRSRRTAVISAAPGGCCLRQSSSLRGSWPPANKVIYTKTIFLEGPQDKFQSKLGTSGNCHNVHSQALPLYVYLPELLEVHKCRASTHPLLSLHDLFNGGPLALQSLQNSVWTSVNREGKKCFSGSKIYKLGWLIKWRASGKFFFHGISFRSWIFLQCWCWTCALNHHFSAYYF
jgi:hypothetical protein